MNLDRLDELLDAYLLGEISPQQSEELQQALQTDSSARRRFVQCILIDARLHRLARSEAAPVVPGQQPAPAPAAPRPRTPAAVARLRRLAIAAILLIAAGALAAFYFLRQGESTSDRVTSGKVLVNGQPQTRIPAGATLTVPGPAPAVIRLSDGSQATLDPATRLILRGQVDGTRQVLQLVSGGGQFQVPHTGGQFRIDTPAGSVTVLGTQFTAVLRSPRTLFVSVLTGTVRVDREGKAFTLGTGQSRLFAPEPATNPALPQVAGAIQSIDLSTRSIVVATDGGPMTYHLTQVLQVTVNGKRGAVANLTPGMNATLTLNPTRTEVREIQVGDVPASQGEERQPRSR